MRGPRTVGDYDVSDAPLKTKSGGGIRDRVECCRCEYYINDYMFTLSAV